MANTFKEVNKKFIDNFNKNFYIPPTNTSVPTIEELIMKNKKKVNTDGMKVTKSDAEKDKVIEPGNMNVVNTAKQYLGTPYVWGGTSPSGFDCSGLMQYAYSKNGISIPRTSQEQFKSGTSVDKNNLIAGDLVFFSGSSGSPSAPGHVGMYIGNGQFIQAPKTGDVVKISNLSDRGDYVGARRYSLH